MKQSFLNKGPTSPKMDQSYRDKRMVEFNKDLDFKEIKEESNWNPRMSFACKIGC